ncbi:FMN-binding protein [Kribbella koreensis]|uniref:FMN-binding protein n=1 Tax=Kribbella koreensis TaxID=57909 RepID=A0ABN1R1U7_9ACTN
MKRIVTWLLSTITVVVLLFGYHTSNSGRVTATPAVIGSAGPAPTPAGTPSPTTSPTDSPSDSPPDSPPATSTPSPAASPSPTSTATTVQGDTADTQWGPVQVQITVAAGKITDVAVLQYPNGNGRDQQINAYALPILINETLTTQSAAIDTISGATVTTDGYTRSLQSALDKAGL